MATDGGNDDFDWVSAQAGCAVGLMFGKLQDGARRDVDRRNASGFGRKEQWTLQVSRGR